jgi:hypothetical protein
MHLIYTKKHNVLAELSEFEHKFSTNYTEKCVIISNALFPKIYTKSTQYCTV